MDLSVVIVNYNVKHFLEQVLLSVEKASRGLQVETWVVDNNSVDGSVDMLRAKFPEVKLIANTDNTGFSKANNQAIKQSSGEYILLLNPDTVVQEDTFHQCLNYMRSHPNVGGLGVRMIDGKGRFLPESKRGLPSPKVALYKMSGLSTLFPKSREFGRYHLKYLPEFETHEIDVLAGAFMMMPKRVLDEIGLLDERFFMYGEDIDLSYRITLAGYKNVYFPDTTIIHYKGESTKKGSANYVKVFYNAMVLFAQKHYSGPMAGSFARIISVAIYMRALMALVHRLGKRVALPLVDFFSALLAFSFLANYWEINHKFVRGYYPDAYYGLHLPAYTLVLMAFVYLSGGYDRPLSFRRTLRGAAAGALVLLALYGLFPKEWQFSRAILGLGSMFAAAIFELSRFVFSRGQLFSSRMDTARKIAIVAGEEECTRIRNLLLQSHIDADAMHWVSVQEPKPLGAIAGLSQLSELVEVHRINTLIFSGKDVGSDRIMAFMTSSNRSGLQVKIAPERSNAIIGSDSKDEPGELFTVDVRHRLSEPQHRRNKRIMDVAISVLGLLLLPVLLCFKNARNSIRHLPVVLMGAKTWVGYGQDVSAYDLPQLKPGVWSAAGKFAGTTFENDALSLYARDYSVYLDVELIWNAIRSKQ
ncbi:MAG: hypothetical protein RL577_861 [Bacteroidota bacterium]|jgi:GT2 family glycosyltransferase